MKMVKLAIAFALAFAVFSGPVYAQSFYGTVDVKSSTLPTGAATSAKQPALGTVSSPSADVLTVQPPARTYITNSSSDVAAASAVATLAAASSKTTYITGFTCTGTGATSASTVTVAVTGTITGTLNYIQTAVAGATLLNPVLNVQFGTPIPASAANTSIVVTMPSLGTGNLHAACNASGFQL